MLEALALAALLIGGIQTAVIVADDDTASARDSQNPVVEVQKVETVNTVAE
jgi:hypothetical protein